MAKRKHSPVNALYLRDPKDGFIYGYQPALLKENPHFQVMYRHPDDSFQPQPAKGHPVPRQPATQLQVQAPEAAEQKGAVGVAIPPAPPSMQDANNDLRQGVGDDAVQGAAAALKGLTR